MTSCQILVGDCVESMRKLPADSVQCVITSPPYWGLRDYGVDGQLGNEETFPEYLATMVGVFEEVRRVLRPDGTAWINMGDSYAGSWGAQGRKGQGMMLGRKICHARQIAAAARRKSGTGSKDRTPGIKPKDMVGQPWRLAFALQEAGWWLRRDIIWSKPNPMPESVYDRPTTAHEYIFLLTKSAKYFYNHAMAREAVTGNSHPRGTGVNPKAEDPRQVREEKATGEKFGKPKQNASFAAACSSNLMDDRNYRSVWTIPTQPFSGSHFATFPEALVTRCITAGTRPGDTVMDPFGGSGTTGKVAIEMGRHAILCELNPEYVKLIEQRLHTTPGLGI